jgi:hypothetical protein
VKNYQKVLAEDVPSDLRSIIEAQYKEILEAHNRIRSLRDGSDVTAGIDTPVGSRSL